MKIRKLLCTLFLFLTICSGIIFVNAGTSFGKGMAFRSFGIALGAAVLTLCVKPSVRYFIFSAVWLPVCYVFTHFAYLHKWIPDTCNYSSELIIRCSKVLILVWGLAFIAYICTAIKEKQSLIPPSKGGRLIAALWALWIVLLSIFNPGYLYNGMFVFCYSVVFIVSADRKRREAFYTALMYAVAFVFAAALLFSLLFRPYDLERYGLCFSNSNDAGEYIAATTAALVTLLYMNSKKKIRYLLISALLVSDLIIAFLNNTRTGIIASLTAAVVLFVCSMRSGKKKDKKRLVRRYVAVIAAFVIMLYPGYLIVRYIPAFVDRPYFFTYEDMDETKVTRGEGINSPKYTSFTDLLREMLGKWGVLIDFGDDSTRADGTEQTEEIEIDTGRDVSNGRMDIWKAYLSKIGIAPHYPGNITLGEDELVYHAHNTYLQVSYQFGIINGLLLGIFAFVSSVYAVMLYVKKKKPLTVFPVMITITTTLAMLTEWMGHPCVVICFLFFMGAGMLMYEPFEGKAS